MLSIIDSLADYVHNKRSNSQVDVCIKFWVIRESDGSNFPNTPAMENETIDEYISYLNYVFAQSQVQFYQFGDVSYIDNSAVLHDPNKLIDPRLMSNVSSCVNFYLHPTITRGVAINPINSAAKENNTIAHFSFDDENSQRYNRDRITFAHEMGHSFGLNHTFITNPRSTIYGEPQPTSLPDYPYRDQSTAPEHLRNPRELVIRSYDQNMPWYKDPNWNQAADFCQDTPACCRGGSSTAAGCVHLPEHGTTFGGTYKDYNDVTASPNVLNIMSYFRANVGTNFMDYHLTPDQCQIIDAIYFMFREDQYDQTDVEEFSGTIKLNGSSTPIPGVMVDIIPATNQNKFSHSLSSNIGKIDGVVHDKGAITSHTFKPGIFATESTPPPTINYFNIYVSEWEHWVAGLSAFDATRINLHVNHSVPLTTGYQKLAADVNFDGLINSTDLVTLNDLLSRKIEKFDAFEHAWRFIPEFIPNQYSTSFNSNPFSMTIQNNLVENGEYTEKEFVYTLTTPELTTSAGFRGIKIGKVGWESHIAIPSVSIRTVEPGNPLVEDGEVYKIKFAIDSVTNLASWQMVLDYDPAKISFNGVYNETLTHSRYQPIYNVDSNKIYIHWYIDSLYAKSTSNNFEIFTLEIEVKGNHSNLYDYLLVDSTDRPTIFTDMYNTLSAQVNITQTKVTNGQKPNLSSFVEAENLYNISPIYPNPFVDFIKVKLNSKIESSMPIELYSLEGKLVKRTSINLVQGINEYTMDNLGNLNSGKYLLRIGEKENAFESIVIKD